MEEYRPEALTVPYRAQTFKQLFLNHKVTKSNVISWFRVNCLNSPYPFPLVWNSQLQWQTPTWHFCRSGTSTCQMPRVRPLRTQEWGWGGAAEDSSFYVSCSRLSVSSDHDRKSGRPTSGAYLLPQTSFVVRPLFRSSVLTHSLKQAIFSPLSDIFCWLFYLVQRGVVTGDILTQSKSLTHRIVS